MDGRRESSDHFKLCLVYTVVNGIHVPGHVFVEFNQVLEGDISQRVSERNRLDVRKFAFG